MNDLMDRLHDISPFVRHVKVTKTAMLSGEWMDYDHVFTYIRQGAADFIIDGVKYRVEEGDAIVMPPLAAHIIRSVSEQPLIQYICHFDLYDCPERRRWLQLGIREERQRHVPERERLLADMPPVTRIRRAERFALGRLFIELRDAYAEPDSLSALRMKALLLELLVAFLRNQPRRSGRDGDAARGWSAIQKAIDYIRAHYENPELTNDGIGAYIGYNASYLSALFKQQLGITIYKYVMHLRVERAKQLMLEGGRTLTEVAALSGFSGIHHFSRAFRKETGVTASAYLAQTIQQHIARRLDDE